MTRVEVTGAIKRHATDVTSEFVMNFGERCPQLIDMAMKEYIARLGHALYALEEADDFTVEDDAMISIVNTAVMHNAVKDRLHKLVDELGPVIEEALRIQLLHITGGASSNARH